MITISKLKTLKESTALRKCALILEDASRNGTELPPGYLNGLISLLSTFEKVDADKLLTYRMRVDDGENLSLLADYIASLTSNGEADWDIRDADGDLDKSKRLIKDRILILDRIRSPYNVGAIFRSADSFGIKKIILTEGSASPEHTRSYRTSRGTTNTVDWEFMSERQVADMIVREKLPTFALETGGKDMNSFQFPSRGAAIAGSEEFGVSKELLNHCFSKATIMTAGTKGSLNVSVAVGLMLWRWFSV